MWQSFKNLYHLTMAVLANIFYGFPSKKLVVVGVTGTDGKTTTAGLIYHILHTSGLNVSLVSTVGAIINGKAYDVGFHVTTPSSWKLQRFLKMIASGSTVGAKRYLVLEVTSHALDQYRVWGIDFTVGVLTNVTHEHFDYHKTWEEYVKAKSRLLKSAKIALINKDDESYKILSSLKCTTYGRQDADVNLSQFTFTTNLIGEFNKYNILAAAAACRALGIADKQIKKAIKTFTPPIGRQEIIHEDKSMVMIDFAHTPNAFEKVLPEVKQLTKGKLIHVFGAAGKRDSSKRPLMGEISAKYADIIILTAEDPRGEDVSQINREIMEGIQKEKNKPDTYSIVERKKAIEFAISLVKEGDTVILTGKGHEQSMNYGKGEVPWSEHEAVRNALKKL